MIYSSRETFLDRQAEPEALSMVHKDKKKLTFWTSRGVEIYDPQIITRKCTACHIHRDWPRIEGEVGGVIYFRASTDALKKIKGTTAITVDEIAQVSQIISAVDEIVATIANAVGEQSQSTAKIANNIAQTSQGIQDLNENARASATFSGEIAINMAEVNQSAAEILTSSTQLNASAADMSDLAAQLHKLVDSFRV